MLRANMYPAAFSAGVTLCAVSPRLRDEFHEFAELVTELLKLGALLAFGALISIRVLSEIPLRAYGFALIVMFSVVRMVALLPALLGSSLDRRERLTAGWFGPKGFASVLYGIPVLWSNIPNAGRLFHITAIIIAGSIILHSSTDVLIAQFRGKELSIDATSPLKNSKGKQDVKECDTS